MFNPNSNDLLTLQPIAPEPVDTDITPEEMEEEPVVLAQNEIFKQSQEKPPTSMEEDEIKWSKNIKMEVEEGVMNKKEVNAWGKEKVRGVGKRGKDKKKRVKKPPTAKQLAHLARMRELAKQKRAATALKKKQAKAEAKRIQKELEDLKPTVKNTKIIKEAVQRAPPKKHYATNTPRQPSKEETFFALMEKYEKYKEAKNFKIRQERTIQERLNEKRRQQAKPHPNRRIPQLQRPAPPANPYHDIFNYKGRL
jgi:hypothetical protein